ncbi:MAG TPA: hypothetical protein VLR49_04140, partial [Ferruginibacter sp.]|nr:hypothetical protein [Ferruginibacter sp.]
SKVGKMVKNAGQVWGGSYISLVNPINFSVNKIFKMKVYSPRVGAKVLLKVEGPNGAAFEKEATTTTANTWETLVFDFANQSAGTAAMNLTYNYDMASVFFDFGIDGAGKIFYWDDVRFLTTNVTPGYLALPLDFQSTTINYAFTNFDGGNATVINNPFPAGINTSTKVGKMVKNAGQVWGGSFISLVNPINFTVNRMFKMKVYSPRIGAKVLLKVEGPNGAAFEKEATTTTANTWELLSFDYSLIDVGRSYQNVVLIFDLGTMGDGSSNFTFYFDDITLN